MKHKGSVSQTYLSRDEKVLPDLIRQARHLATYPISTMKLYQIAADLPTDKFYIADDAAYVYILKRMFKGVHIKFRNNYKQKLYDAFYEEVSKMMRMDTYKKMSVKNVVILALLRPAPCVGLAPWGIWKALLRQRKKKNEKV